MCEEKKSTPVPLVLPTAGPSTVSGQAGIDTIRFGAGIEAGDITFVLDGRDLVLNNTVAGDRITIKDYAHDEACQIEQVLFEDGTAWDAAYLQSRIAALLPVATEGDDVIRGWAGQNAVLQGLGENDILLGTMGGDTAHGGIGSNLFVDFQQIIFDGESGNDARYESERKVA